MRRSRIEARDPLTLPERHLLETGNPYPDKGSWKDQGLPWVRAYTLVSPAGRDELRALWYQHRADIMAAWRGKKPPWAAKEFENGGKDD